MKALDSKIEYSIGWIAALPIEGAAATAVLDEQHGKPLDFEQDETDPNSYTWGCISNHHVVIASLPAGGYGLTNATKVALSLFSSCPHIKIGLLVGIGAGVPECGLDIRLGDITVSLPQGNSSGVVQYDTGKTKTGGWERIGTLVPPPSVLLHAVAKLQTAHELGDSQIPTILKQAAIHNSRFADNYLLPNAHDCLFENDIDLLEVQRPSRSHFNPVIHYGTIASGNKLIKGASARKEIFHSLGMPCICLEMEAAGLMNSFPCLVIRGICDYADAHKNDVWQRYASATAAAYAKELLLHVRKPAPVKTKRIEQTLKEVQSALRQVNETITRSDEKARDDRIAKALQLLYTHSHEERKDRNPKRVSGTCEWFTRHRLFRQWLTSRDTHILWASADPGCGKSVLARYLIDEVLPQKDRTIAYFFFKDDFEDQKTATNAGCIILHQVLETNRHTITESILHEFEACGQGIVTSLSRHWDIMMKIRKDIVGEIVLVIDALGECHNSERSNFVEKICSVSISANIKLLILSRPYFSIQQDLDRIEGRAFMVHLAGEDDEEREQISQEIDIVIHHRIGDFCRRRQLQPEEQDYLLEKFRFTPHRTYLWAYLTLEILEDTLGFTKGNVRQLCEELPPTVNAAYTKILERSVDHEKTRLILHLIVAGERPFSVREIGILLALNETVSKYGELVDALEPEERFRSTLRNLCGLFVIVVDKRVYLLHQTAREFLVREVAHAKDTTSMDQASVASNTRWKHSIFLPTADYKLAERCVRHIWLCSYRSRQNSLYTYCSVTWAAHTRKSDIQHGAEILDIIATICTPSPGNDAPEWFHRFWIRSEQHLRRLFGISIGPNYIAKRIQILGAFPLVLGAFLGLPALVNGFLEASENNWSKQVKSMALWWSIYSGSLETVQLLLESGADSNVTTDSQAARLTPTTNPDRIPSEALTTFQWLPLANAVRLEHEEIILLLLRHGAEPNLVCGDFDTTALHIASGKGNKSIVRLLLDNGASRDMKDRRGRWPLMYFIDTGSHDNSEVCRSLCDLLWMDSAKNVEDDCGKTLLHAAARASCESCTSFLLRSGFDVDIRNAQHSTPLHYAAAPARGSNTIKLLLKLGADLNATNEKGFSALHFARYSEAVDVLVSSGANINTRSDDGSTPLIFACYNLSHYGSRQLPVLLRSMLHHGADCNMKDNKGRTAIHVLLKNVSRYCREGVNNCIQVLAKAGAFLTEENKLRIQEINLDV